MFVYPLTQPSFIPNFIRKKLQILPEEKSFFLFIYLLKGWIKLDTGFGKGICCEGGSAIFPLTVAGNICKCTSGIFWKLKKKKWKFDEKESFIPA